MVPVPRKLTFFSSFTYANYDAFRHQTVIERRGLEKDRRPKAVAKRHKSEGDYVLLDVYMTVSSNVATYDMVHGVDLMYK